MENSVIEAQYPLSFRKDDSEALGKQLRSRHSVSLIGMRRVGISNFLRFFLHHKDVVKTYIGDEAHFFIAVDLADLVEREIFSFWRLTFKRVADSVENSSLPADVKNYAENKFSNSIQSQDLFLTIDSLRKVLLKLIEANVVPTIFYIRFDRIKDAIIPAFLDNLEGLINATQGKLAYVFTSDRNLDKISPEVFTKTSLSAFAHTVYIRPAEKEDTYIIYETYKKKYHLELSEELKEALFQTVDGHVQYLQLGLIFLHEQKDHPLVSNLFDLLSKDERISLQSEELWDSLTKEEQVILVKVNRGEAISDKEKQQARYLWETGLVADNGKMILFNPLFSLYIKQKDKAKFSENRSIELTKKEHALFKLLQASLNEVCEREKIVESVWPEVEAYGVSDWAIDRLVARVRSKLKLQKSEFEIQTVKTRGYKLVTS